jgi:CubicO group peptidase (beta-lactamase class C family)
MIRPALLFVLVALGGHAAQTHDRVEAFVASLDVRVPELLLRHHVPSAVVSIVHDGRTMTRAWGVTDIQTGRAPSERTLYNVASISKVVTAWGVMSLAEQGKVDLDAPISRYVSRWRLPPSPASDEVTVRRLLSHTSGLSMPAVPWYAPEVTVPPIPEMLAAGTDPLRLIDAPGAASHYSGGGYALLQLLIEEVSGDAYETFIERHVFQPLGMTDSSFRVPDSASDAATPYDAAMRRLPHYRFAATGAAGLYTTASDLARFAAASLRPRPGGGVLTPATVADMQRQAQPKTPDPFGHGLGYGVIPLAAGGHLVGHSGSNEGWTAEWVMNPATGDALVILLNRSDGFPVYRDLLCDWADASSGGRWPGFCDPNRLTWTPADAAFVDSQFATTTSEDPAAAVLVGTADGVVYRKAFGSRDVRAGVPASSDTPFYVASLAKSLTAVAALQLVAQRRWSLTDPIGKFLPELPVYVRSVSLEQLLSHTAGVPDYHDLIDWKSYGGIDNARAIALLGKRRALDFPAGSRYRYSNTGYILIASAIERVTGRPFRDVLRRGVLTPLGMQATHVDDGRLPPPRDRAIGYRRDGNALVISDYHTATIDGRPFDFRSATVGSGGLYSTVDDLHAFTRAFDRDRLLPLPLATMAVSPRTMTPGEHELPDMVGHGFGWFVSRRENRTLVWNSGDFGGHHTAIVRVPDRQLVVIVLSSAADRSAIALASAIIDRVLAQRK